jgi:DNA-binding SARP family transcriptional activator
MEGMAEQRRLATDKAIFRILGPLEVTTAAGEPVAVPQPLHRATLTALLMHAGQLCSRTWLIATIWHSPPPSGATALRTAIYGVRKDLGEPLGARVQTRQAGPIAGGYLINAEDTEVDLLAFRALVRSGHDAWYRGDARGAELALAEARRLWRGRPFADLPDTPGMAAEMAALQKEQVEAEDAWLDARLAQGQYRQVAMDLRAIVAFDPLREHAWALLMLALDRCGDQAGALAAFARARAALASEYGAQPGPELTEMMRQVRPRAPGSPVPDLPR